VEGKEQAKDGKARPSDAVGRELTEEEQRVVAKLKQLDREVRIHEQAHAAAAGQYAIGGPIYHYEKGPDGRRYAIGGEVRLDTAPIPGEPEATIAKMQQIRAAAMAPADPSGQDQRVAEQARNIEALARRDQNAQTQARSSGRTARSAVAYQESQGPVEPADLDVTI